jgi:hypothetical protein
MLVPRKGMALVTVMLLCTILLMMLIALFVTVRGRLLAGVHQAQSVAALYVAEAGIADAMVALGSNLNWPGTSAPVRVGDGYYTVKFHTTGPYTNVDSVNNLSGIVAADSHRGDDTVPPGSALVIVEARVAASRRVVEVLLQPGALGPAAGIAVHTTGRVLLDGDVAIDGIKSLEDNTAVPAGIHSTNSTVMPDLIKWFADPGDTATISGKVSAVSTDPSAISLTGATLGQSSETGAAAIGLRTYDVLGTISAQSGKPAPAVNPAGRTVLDGGAYYVSGDLDLNGGDLVLKNGAKLYVDGDLRINGSLSGSGSVYVANTTTLQGDTALSSQATGNLALLSHGDVNLSGFDGTAYLQGLGADDPALAAELSELTDTLSKMQEFLATTPSDQFRQGGAAKDEVELYRRALGQTDGAGYLGRNNLLRKLHQKVLTKAASKQRDFVAARLDHLDRFFDGASRLGDGTDGSTASREDVLLDWTSGTKALYGGWFDAAMDVSATSPQAALASKTLKKMAVQVQQMGLDRLGTSYFDGTIYTRGSLRAQQEVNVVGAVMVDGDPSQPDNTAGARVLKPGDLLLRGGARITLVENMAGASGPPGAGDLRISAWLGR